LRQAAARPGRGGPGRSGLGQALEDLARGRQGGGDVLGAVGRAHEAGLVQRRGDVDAAFQQAVEEAVEAGLSVFITAA
jgi:hypothetical protein